MARMQAFAEVLAKVRDAARAKNAVGAFARSLLPLLEAAVATDAVAGVTRASKRGTGDISYIVERTQQGEVLTENRPGRGSKPFRCPKVVYEAMIAVLGEADRGLTTDEITAGLEKRLGVRPPDHQLRVVLRLFLHVQPSLLTRNRARYRGTSEFTGKAEKLWDRLRLREQK